MSWNILEVSKVLPEEVQMLCAVFTADWTSQPTAATNRPLHMLVHGSGLSLGEGFLLALCHGLTVSEFHLHWLTVSEACLYWLMVSQSLLY